jgi:ribosomal protein S18 acetylase RimI-like enzyme
MESLIIVPVTLNDVEKLQTISRITFSQTFMEHNSVQDMDTYLNKNFSIPQLNSEIANTDSEFYFAKDGEMIIGYLKVNTSSAQTEIKDLAAFEIERIYVDQSYLGKKIGQQLFEKAIELAKAKNKSYVWLGVWEENHRALAFYKKNGFVPFDKHIFKLGNDEQTDIMMKLEL